MKFWGIRYVFGEMRVAFLRWRLRRLMGEVSHEHECRVGWRR